MRGHVEWYGWICVAQTLVAGAGFPSRGEFGHGIEFTCLGSVRVMPMTVCEEEIRNIQEGEAMAIAFNFGINAGAHLPIEVISNIQIIVWW